MIPAYFTRRFGSMPGADTLLSDLPGFCISDRIGLAMTIEEATDGRRVPTDAQALSWASVGDVLAWVSEGAEA